MFAVECLQASSSPLHLFIGDFSGPTVLLVKELSLELYMWSIDLSDNYFELHKLCEEFTFFKIQSAAKVTLADCDGVIVRLIQIAGANSLRLYRFNQRKLDMLTLFELPAELGLGFSVKAQIREDDILLGTAAIEDNFWLGSLKSLQIHEIVIAIQTRVPLEGIILDWDFCDSGAIVLHVNPGAQYADIMKVSPTGEIQVIASLAHRSPDVKDFPVNLVVAPPHNFFVFFSSGSMLNFTLEGNYVDVVAIDKLYSASCRCPTGLYFVSDDGGLFHISTEMKMKLIEECTQDSLIAYTDNLLLTWSAMGCGQAFLFSGPHNPPSKHVLPGHGPIFDAFQSSSETFICVCGVGPASTLRKAEKTLDVYERVRMPEIGATATGIWAVQDHLFVSYSTETKCIDLGSYAEVEVSPWNFKSAASIEVGHFRDTFVQVTRDGIYGRNLNTSFTQTATTARIRGGLAFVGLVRAQLNRYDLSELTRVVTVAMEAEIAALHVDGQKVYAGLTTNKVIVFADTLAGPPLLTVDLTSYLKDSVPNDILAQHGGFYVGMRDGNLAFVLDNGNVVTVLTAGAEPVHLCLHDDRVIAASSQTYALSVDAGVVNSTMVLLANARHVCSLPEGFAVVTTDLSLGVVAKELDYHMTFEVLISFPATVRRVYPLGPFIFALLEESPPAVLIIDATTYEMTDKLKLEADTRYLSIGHSLEDGIFLVGGEFEKKGVLHLCSLFPASIVSTSKFICPVRAVALTSEGCLVVASGPQLFLMRILPDHKLEEISIIRVRDEIVDLDISENSLLVTQVTFGVLLYTVKDDGFELAGSARLENQCLFSSLFWNEFIVCFSKEGELIVLDRSKMNPVAHTALWEGGRKLVRTKDAQRVLAFTMSGSVFSLWKDEDGRAAEQQKAVLDSCLPYLNSDFLIFRSSLNVTDLDFLRKCANGSSSSSA